MKTLKWAIGRLLVVLLSLLLSLIFLEIIMRFIPHGFHYKTPKPLFETLHRPLNLLRYHDYDYPVEKSPSVFRIIVMGDSFTEGGGVDFEDTYPKRLERYLNYVANPHGINFQVMNLSRGGRATSKEVRTLKGYIERLRPDMIILGYCLNDSEDWENPRALAKLRKKCCYYPSRKREGWRGFLYTHSALAHFVLDREFAHHNVKGYKRYFHKLYRDTYPGWQKCRLALQELGELSRSTHTPLEIIIFPLFSFGLDENYPFADIHKILHTTFEEAGISYTDLFPYYKGYDHLYMEVRPYENPHPNEIAHRIAAEVLARKIAADSKYDFLKQASIDGKRFPVAPPRYNP